MSEVFAARQQIQLFIKSTLHNVPCYMVRIHMNGRIYDPNLGRFLSVDPVFEFPTNTQSLNPYSYVLNNPLSMTDPTGYAASCITNSDGSTTCTGSVTVKTNAIDLGSHIVKHGETTFTATLDKAHVMQMTARGNGFGLGETAEVSLDRGAGNGAQMTQGAADAQNKPAQHTDIGSPTQTQTDVVTQGTAQLGTASASSTNTTPAKKDPFDIDLLAPSDMAYKDAMTYVRTPKTAKDFIVIGHGNSLGHASYG